MSKTKWREMAPLENFRIKNINSHRDMYQICQWQRQGALLRTLELRISTVIEICRCRRQGEERWPPLRTLELRILTVIDPPPPLSFEVPIYFFPLHFSSEEKMMASRCPVYEIISQKNLFLTNDGFPDTLLCCCNECLLLRTWICR